ncbi:MAG: macro domain-containing protein [Pseudomonadales bacterium]|uniref:ADP-ribose processing enzyme n=1 Tax=Oleiphilus messinensis TaxID=141451 RepID=A0A1Y0I929_9GAMM|nr:macro domain-containing protein [Oleiphilus messinensis]ARU57027.1 ADP-ribose processing enzyme [Oleiphilus messinensis]MCG8614026.1 macro domain-containing protein [Pseudomonadales bacterium]
MNYEIVHGDILNQDVEVIVNSWNRNIIPWWILLPQGVSGAIKKKGGTKPFKEVAKYGPIPLGEARVTSAGTLPFQAIIHVAGINMFWVATKYSVTHSVRSVIQEVRKNNFASVAIPLIGAGSGNRSEMWSLDLIKSELEHIECDAKVLIVRYA